MGFKFNLISIVKISFGFLLILGGLRIFFIQNINFLERLIGAGLSIYIGILLFKRSGADGS